MNKLYLVSYIERCEDEYEFFSEFHLFTRRRDAENCYNNFLQAFQEEKKSFDFDYESEDDWYHHYTWSGDANNMEIRLTELMPK